MSDRPHPPTDAVFERHPRAHGGGASAAVAIDAVLDAVTSAERRRLLEALTDGEHTVGALAARLGLAQPTVSKHLRRLRETGLVRVRADAQRRFYALDVTPLRAAHHWMGTFLATWDRRLAALEAHLDRLEEP